MGSTMRALAKSALRKIGYHVQGTRYTPRQLLNPGVLRTLEFDDVICRRMYEFGTALTFIQIGAFDGITNDPLRKYIERCNWRGIMLEPQPGPFEKLTGLYEGNDRITILQAAVDKVVGQKSLYTVDVDDAPEWAKGMASFDLGTVTKNVALLLNSSANVREISVPCITFNEILERTEGPLDLLQIDAEGADAYLLSLFPLNRNRPAIIHFEIKHLTNAQREDCFDNLIAHGYRISPSGSEDFMAVL